MASGSAQWTDVDRRAGMAMAGERDVRPTARLNCITTRSRSGDGGFRSTYDSVAEGEGGFAGV